MVVVSRFPPRLGRFHEVQQERVGGSRLAEDLLHNFAVDIG